MRRLVGPAVALVGLIAAASPVGATGPGLNGKLIYSSGTGIVVANADGSSAAYLMFGNYYSPVWSPDGQRFAVEFSGDIWTFDATGNDPIQITSGTVYDESPAWSPDGTRVIFGRYLSDREAIYSASATGGGTPKKLSKPAAGKYDFSPAWSPDGRKIAFNRDKDHGHRSYDIWTMNADGTAPKLFLLNHLFNAYPAWSPDSKRLVWEQRANKRIILQSRALSGGPIKTLTTTTSYEPEYSPDGKSILFQDGKGHIKRIPVNGGTPVQVVQTGYGVSWQPTCNQATPPEGGTLTGTAKAELLCGGPGPDTVNASGGNDHVFTYGDADTLNGGDGDDILVGGDSTDTFNGGPGSDRCVQGEGSGTKTACERS